ncbi:MULTISPECIES: FUSC family protein [Streptomyces]|uniref:Putative membrane protein YccC n=1 Tax=Streptomyces stelliscabiei TaxID=146820 RepID=A0A8I0PBH4_9ACTN|nr:MULTISPECIES: FUSC family protein [Streptomyces]KND44017.1 membrane protein [Streptomyces stelliscabiei]MBE1598653.1 putative membrane protein YccC [Streptomyces stelliscabiei]MDX2516555.1 FUSC family protein [Streptomyces stelliscabiei]MDX2553563.1 FUSC family protein [Streptomyces stelliscabiei]MDX2613461.1 FUSC family protein [Streptomyces stelliscabiei]
MSRPFPIGLAPPDWLVRNLQPQPTPVNRPAVARAAIALTLPLVLGLAAGRPEYGALASMGALSGVISDTAAAYRMRLLNIAVPQLFAAVGITLGSLVYGQGWVTVAALTLAALVSGMISSIGAVASVSGLLLLLNSVVGAGLPMPGQWWLAPVLMTGGGLLVLALALFAWPLRAGVPERDAVADTYRKVADLLATTTADDPAGHTDAYDAARHIVTQSLNQSYDLVLARRARHHGRSPELVRLLAQLNAVTPLVEAAPAVRLSGRPLPAEIPVAVRHLAEAVETGYSGPLGLRLPEPRSEIGRAVDQALRHAADVATEKSPDALRKAGDRSGGPAPLGVRAARVARNVALSGASWRYGLRLALCIGIAQALVSLVPVPRSYWVALTITFVLKPDFGSVFSRALLRALGTVVGLVVAAGILAEVPRGWWDVPVMLLLAPLIPVFTPRGYGYQTAAITPVILLLSDVLNHQGTGLLVPRLVDSLMGCAIALVAGYLLWPESWHARVGARLADAVADTAAYVEAAFGAEPADPADRTRMRRRLYRDLSAIRTEFQRALTEPPPIGRRAAAWWPLVVAAERIVDATTAARVRIKQGAQPPSAAEVDQVALQLRELSDGLRRTETLYEVRSDLSGPPGSVLEPLRQEVAAARAITSPL